MDSPWIKGVKHEMSLKSVFLLGTIGIGYLEEFPEKLQTGQLKEVFCSQLSEVD